MMSTVTLENPVVDYHTRPEISRSMLATFVKSRREFEAKHITKTLSCDFSSSATDLGSLTHGELLEPHIKSRVQIPPKDVLASDGKRAGNKYKEWLAANPGVISMTQKDYDVAMRAVDSVRKTIGMMIDHPQAERESELFWTDEETGLEMRMKLDLLVPTRIGTHIIDIKTCADLTKFIWQVRDGLYLQVAHYLTGLKAARDIDGEFWFCVVEKSGVYRVRNFKLSEQTQEIAFMKYREALSQLAECYQTGDWSEEGEGSIEEIHLTTF